MLTGKSSLKVETGPGRPGRFKVQGGTMARTFALLAVARVISGPAPGWLPGFSRLTLGRAGFAPARRRAKFIEGMGRPGPILTRIPWLH